MKRTLLALGGVVMLLATGCGSSGTRTSASTSPATAPLLSTTTAPTTTVPDTPTDPPTTVPDTSVVPRTITVAYVNAVLGKLNHVYGDALRSLVAAKKLTAPVFVDLSAIYETKLYAEEINLFATGTPTALSDTKRRPGDRRMTIVRLVSASPTCIFAQVTINESAVDKHIPPAPYSTYEGLEADRGLTFKSDPNPTPWKFFDDLALTGPERVADACVSTSRNS